MIRKIALFALLFIYLPLCAHASTVQLPKTGQTTSYYAGDDGERERGVAWPGIRFANHGNGTVTDSSTGLMWTQNANLMATRDSGYGSGGRVTWQRALDYVKKLNAERYQGYSDWRLPNRKELRSLVDLSRYNPALPAGHPFSNAQANWYWSSSTYARYTDCPWVVHLNDGYVGNVNKASSYYVWPVRSGQVGAFGSSGLSNTLQITADGTNPIGTQAAGSAFPITIRALDINGNTDIGFNGGVSLLASSGSITPNSVNLSGGTASLSVTLTSGGACAWIAANGLNTPGKSTPFNVTSTSGSIAKLGGTVTDKYGVKLEGVTVTLTSCSGPKEVVITNSYGNYQFTGLMPGSYTVQANNDVGAASAAIDVFLTNELPSSKNLELAGITCYPDGKTPILLMPGIMGSSNGWGPQPWLPAGKPSWKYEDWDNNSWGLHDPLKVAGWRILVHDLEAQGYEVGCTLFPVPYDWRMTFSKASQEYLEKVIDRAKTVTGAAKVNVVSHSMGGLVTRSYIQSDRYKNDIDKFAMVGTPNHGSANAYYIWEGGDPDAIGGDGFYAKTIKQLYSTMKSGKDASNLTNKQIRDFVQTEAESVRDLLPTYTFLADSTHSFGLEKEKNHKLIDLNDSFGLKGVSTKLYAGTQQDTISMITVGDPNNLYVDGKPKSTYTISSGDGTVLQTSVDLPGLSLESLRSGEHSGLIGYYGDAIISFVAGTGSGSSAVNSKSTTLVSKVLRSEAAPTGPTITLTLLGRVSPEIVDPSGNKSGINPATGLRENEIPDSSFVLQQGSGAINIDNAADGLYTVTISGPVSEDYRLFLSYMDGVTNIQKPLLGFHNGTATTFTFTLDAASTEKLTVNRTPQPATNLQAVAISGTPLMTRLVWAASLEAGVTGYRVYSRVSNEPSLVLIGTTTDITFDPGHPWATDIDQLSRFYAVSAIMANGTESFLAEMVENRASLSADFGADVIRGKAPLTVSFTDKSTGYITGRQWEFEGDGVIDSTDTNPVKTFAADGVYPVTLILTGPGTTESLTRSSYIIVDSQPPTVTSLTPPANTTGVAVTTPVIITFNEALDPATISFTLKNGTVLVDGSGVYDPATNTLTFTPTGTLAYDTLYTASLAAGVKDLTGNSTTAPTVWIFRTVPPPPGNITGKVTDSAGVGITGVLVCPFAAANNYSGSGSCSTTQVDGSYSFTGLVADTYKLLFTGFMTGYLDQWYNNKASLALADTVTVTAGATTSNINATLMLGGTINGKVTNSAGVGIASVPVFSLDVASGAYYSSANTQADGTYSLTRLPAGSYKIVFNSSSGGTGYISQWYNNKTSSSQADAIEVTTGSTTNGIDATMIMGAIITGRITNSSGTGLAGISVYASGSSGAASVTTLSDGNYTISGLSSGSYKLSFNGSNSGYIAQWYNNKTSSALADSVSVTAGTITPNINAILALGGSVSGRVTDPIGNGVQSVLIQVFNLEGSSFSAVFTDSQGYYHAGGLPSGAVTVHFRVINGTFSGQWYSNKGEFGSADTLVITGLEDIPAINAVLGVGQDIYAIPVMKNYGNYRVNASTISSSFYIYNDGSAPLTLGALGLTGSHTAEFSFQNELCSGKTITPGGSCSFVAVFKPTTVGAKNAVIEIPSNDPDTPVLHISISGTGTPDTANLEITFLGDGSGSVHSVPAAISCIKGNSAGCNEPFAIGTPVTLTADPDNTSSIFSGWSNACSAVPCEISIDTGKTATVTFNLAPRSKLALGASSGYDTLQEAYSNAGSDIFAMEGLFAGELLFDKGKHITMKGGYRADYGPTRSGFTILNGKVTLINGSLRVNGVKFRQQ